MSDSLVIYTVAVLVSTLAISGLRWMLNDYHDWIAFGTGGLPSNLSGYAKMSYLRLYRNLSFYDSRCTDGLPRDKPRCLDVSSITLREGERPIILSRPLPQRQIPEPIAREITEALLGLSTKLASQLPHLLYTQPSITEGRHTLGLYAKAEAVKTPMVTPLLYEIAHVHCQDGSSHLSLPLEDVRVVVERGWGEQFGAPNVMPKQWIMVYAPRNKEELKVVEEIWRSAVQHVVGIKPLGI